MDTGIVEAEDFVCFSEVESYTDKNVTIFRVSQARQISAEKPGQQCPPTINYDERK